jgi:hypothetical protein
VLLVFEIPYLICACCAQKPSMILPPLLHFASNMGAKPDKGALLHGPNVRRHYCCSNWVSEPRS